MWLLDERLDSLLDKRKAQGRFRSLKVYNTVQSNLIDLSSNDYLSLTSSASLRASYLERLASTQSILGSTGSRLLSGATPDHAALEERFADLFNAPSALLFNSGWDANVSFFSTVPQAGDWVVYDELVHASAHSGMRASRVAPDHRIPFAHNSPDALSAALSQIPVSQETVFLAFESLYSMDGDIAPVKQLLDVLDGFVARERQCVIVDEAHSTGLFGYQGRGLVHAHREEGGWGDGDRHASGSRRRRGKARVSVRLSTFGKAVGCSGAVLLCSPIMRSFLINFARPLIFSTALPHSTLVALHCAWDLLESSEGDSRRSGLFHLAMYLHATLQPLLARAPQLLRLTPLSTGGAPAATSGPARLSPDSLSPIVPLLTSTPHALSAFLLEKGFIVRPVVPPTVPPGGERVRICLRVGLRREDIDNLVQALEEWVDSNKIAPTPPPEATDSAGVTAAAKL